MNGTTKGTTIPGPAPGGTRTSNGIPCGGTATVRGRPGTACGGSITWIVVKPGWWPGPAGGGPMYGPGGIIIIGMPPPPIGGIDIGIGGIGPPPIGGIII